MVTHVEEFTAFIQQAAHGEKSPPAGYSGASHFDHGIRIPTLRAFIKTWSAQHKTLTRDEWLALLDALYHGDSLDEKLLAGQVLAQYPALRRDLPLELFETWLEQLEGWEEIDGTCQSTFSGKEVLARWDEWNTFLIKLRRDANINKQRASLVLLNRSVRESADARLINLALEQVEALKAEKDKRITKAISWILREAIKQ